MTNSISPRTSNSFRTKAALLTAADFAALRTSTERMTAALAQVAKSLQKYAQAQAGINDVLRSRQRAMHNLAQASEALEATALRGRGQLPRDSARLVADEVCPALPKSPKAASNRGTSSWLPPLPPIGPGAKQRVLLLPVSGA